MARRWALESQVEKAIQRHGLQGSTLLVAVSGGSDSTALLHCFHALAGPMALCLHVAHFDHNFRPEAKEDARFVAQAATRLGLPLASEHGDPLAYQREQRISSFEAAARELRYDFLARAATQVGATAVALGHTADDQAETVLMHLIRGSGLDGLKGMSCFSVWHSSDGQQQANLFRPLLAATKDQLRAYCRERDIDYREDPANQDLRFTRNRVRHQLIPMLKEYNPRVSRSLLGLARAVSQEIDLLEAEASRIWPLAATVREGVIELDREALATCAPAMQARLLRRAYQTLVGSTRRLQEDHLDAMMSIVEGPSGKRVSLPFGLHLVSGHQSLAMGRRTEDDCPYPPLSGEHQLALPGQGSGSAVTRLDGWKVLVERVSAEGSAPLDGMVAVMDADKLGPDLWVRCRRPGDRFQPFGMAGEKKLQDFLVDEKTPRGWRDRIPLLVASGGIAWVVGHRVAHWAAVVPTSRNVLRIQFEPEAEGPQHEIRRV